MEKKGKGGFWDHSRIIFGLHENVPFWMVLWLVGVGIIYNNRKISSVFLTRQGFCHCLFLNCLKSCFKQLGIKKDTIDLAKSQR